MIMYMLILVVAFFGVILFSYTLSEEITLFHNIGIALGVHDFMPVTIYYYIASIFLVLCALICTFIRIRTSGCSRRFDKLKRGIGLFHFIYRDGGSVDVYGTRIPGLGFFRIPKLGIVVDTGRKPQPGSVYNYGDKKIRFALQDINYSPNPKMTSFYTYLVNLGFNNMQEVQDVFNGYNPELIAKIWHNMLNQDALVTAEDKLVGQIQTMSKQDVHRNNRLWRLSMKKKGV